MFGYISKKDKKIAKLEKKVKYRDEFIGRQRQTIDKLKETNKKLKQQNKEAILSLYYRFDDISKIGHSDNINKNIEIMKIVDTTMKELYEDIKEDLYIENDEGGKLIELVNEYEAKH